MHQIWTKGASFPLKRGLISQFRRKTIWFIVICLSLKPKSLSSNKECPHRKNKFERFCLFFVIIKSISIWLIVMKNEKLKIKRWEPLEKFRYYLFLVLKSRIFKSGKSTQLKRKESIFKEMEDFIGNKTREQCRSHHTKMIDYLRKRMGNKEVWEL